jgi:hypothetical protein
MATKLDPSELVTFKELLIANSIQIDTTVKLPNQKSMYKTWRKIMIGTQQI